MKNTRYPTEPKNSHSHELVYAPTPTPWGQALLFISPQGLRELRIGGSLDQLIKEVQQAHPSVKPASAAAAEPYITQLQEYLAGKRREFDLPLDLAGTAFQQRVWAALCRIPYGQTQSYAAVARAVGSPVAVRAVGQACGANPVVVVVPCHRVVRTDGSLGGFGYGLEMKTDLLALERRS